MIQLQYFNGNKWINIGEPWNYEALCWTSLGTDNRNYRTVDKDGKVLTDMSVNPSPLKTTSNETQQELSDFNIFLINEINSYQVKRDGYKEGTVSFETYDLVVRQMRKTLDKYVQEVLREQPSNEAVVCQDCIAYNKKSNEVCWNCSLPLCQPPQREHPEAREEQNPDDGFLLRKIDTNKHYWCKCENCGWEDSSEFLEGGAAIADTGDFSDPVCPVCFSNKIEGEPKLLVPDGYTGEHQIKIPIRLVLEPYQLCIKQLNDTIDDLRFPKRKEQPEALGEKLINWIEEMENSVFALSTPENELKILAQFKTKIKSLSEESKPEEQHKP